jgi:hypothetical protein
MPYEASVVRQTRLECCLHHDEVSTIGAPQYMTERQKLIIQQH